MGGGIGLRRWLRFCALSKGKGCSDGQSLRCDEEQREAGGLTEGAPCADGGEEAESGKRDWN